jgi:hypothetical protein
LKSLPPLQRRIRRKRALAAPCQNIEYSVEYCPPALPVPLPLPSPCAMGDSLRPAPPQRADDQAVARRSSLFRTRRVLRRRARGF